MNGCLACLQTEFHDFVLVTGGAGVKVREVASTRASQTVHVEGQLSDDFFKIREAIYGMHSAV